MTGHRNDARSLGELLAELSRETSQLVRKEVELATTEMTAKAKNAGAGAGVAAAGGALVHAGLLSMQSRKNSSRATSWRVQPTA